jgi:hypothetical protein
MKLKANLLKGIHYSSSSSKLNIEEEEKKRALLNVPDNKEMKDVVG